MESRWIAAEGAKEGVRCALRCLHQTAATHPPAGLQRTFGADAATEWNANARPGCEPLIGKIVPLARPQDIMAEGQRQS